MKVLCQKCQKKPAVFHYEQTVNGNKTACALCADCAAEWKHSHHMDEETFFSGMEETPFFGINSLFGSLFSPMVNEYKGKTCPLCGSTFNDLRRTGKAGCATCYQVFESELRPTLRSIHGTQSHTGRTPASLETETKKKKQLEELKKSMASAIEAQEFEEAARLRDQIKSLEENV